MRPPGKTSAPAANAMFAARSIIRISGAPEPVARITIKVAAGIGGGRSSDMMAALGERAKGRKGQQLTPFGPPPMLGS